MLNNKFKQNCLNVICLQNKVKKLGGKGHFVRLDFFRNLGGTLPPKCFKTFPGAKL